MSDSTFRFELVCPEGMVFEADVEHVLIPGAEGDFMVMPDHAPLISTLRPGLLEVSNEKQEKTQYYVSSGLAEVNPTSLTILAQQALDTTKLDKNFFPTEIKSLENDIENTQDQVQKDILISQVTTMRSIADQLGSA